MTAQRNVPVQGATMLQLLWSEVACPARLEKSAFSESSCSAPAQSLRLRLQVERAGVMDLGLSWSQGTRHSILG